MAESADELSVEAIKAKLKKQREAAGAPAVSASDAPVQKIENGDLRPEKVREALRATRACAIQNANSAVVFQEVQAATPGRGTPTSKFKTRGPQSGVMKKPDPTSAQQAAGGDAKQQKEPS